MDSIFNVARSWQVREDAQPRMELVEYDESYTVKPTFPG